MQVKILDFVSLPGETSKIVSNSLLETLNKNNLTNKLVAYCADNANTNFGGVNRKGDNNIFSEIKNKLPLKILGVGCAAHIVNNAINTAADLLPVDIESIVTKIYGYFYIFTVRTEKLKEFCEEADVTYRKLLGYSKTRWLALMPAIERILKLYNPLKAYFLSVEKCPKVIEIFFKDESSEFWMKFLHAQSALFYDTVKKIEGNKVTIMEVADELNLLKAKYRKRIEEEYVPSGLKSDLTKLVENGILQRLWCISHIKLFYSNCLQYLELWTAQFSEVNHFNWTRLKEALTWNDVEKSFEYLSENFAWDNESDLFDEFSCVQEFVSEEKVQSWNDQNIYLPIPDGSTFSII